MSTYEKRFAAIRAVSRMSNAELDYISNDEDHPLYSVAFDELILRQECARDSRVAQALGCEFFSFPS